MYPRTPSGQPRELQLDDYGRLKVAPGGTGTEPANKSGTIALGGTAQILMAANAARQGFWIQNLSNADLWINSLGGAAAAPPSLKVHAGALYEPPQGGCPFAAISIFGAATGQAFSAREW